MRVECVCRSCSSVIPYVIRTYVGTCIRLRFAHNNAGETPSPLGRRRSEKTAVTIRTSHSYILVLLFRYSIPKIRVSSSFNLHSRRVRPLM